MDSKLAKLQGARHKLSKLEAELAAYLSRQHSIRFDLIEQDPHYQQLQRRLRRAKGVVRSLQRGR